MLCPIWRNARLTLVAAAAAVLALSVATAAAAQPIPQEVPRPFEQGNMRLGLILGLAAGGGETTFTVGGAFGYDVLPGLAPGIEGEVTFGGPAGTVGAVLPYLRWVLWRSYNVSPFIKLQGGWIRRGYLFEDLSTKETWSEGRDLGAIGGGGGLVFFLGRNVGLQLEALYLRLLPESECAGECDLPRFGISLGVYFGGGSPSQRRRQQQQAPPPPSAPPVSAPIGPASGAPEPGVPEP
jgi:hypothetical protein